jgi:hypothetical protein
MGLLTELVGGAKAANKFRMVTLVIYGATALDVTGRENR